MNCAAFEDSSGNVYADLGFSDAEVMKVKAQLVSSITQKIEVQEVQLDRAAQVLGLALDDLNKLLAGHFRPYSTDELERMHKAIQQHAQR